MQPLLFEGLFFEFRLRDHNVLTGQTHISGSCAGRQCCCCVPISSLTLSQPEISESTFRWWIHQADLDSCVSWSEGTDSGCRKLQSAGRIHLNIDTINNRMRTDNLSMLGWQDVVCDSVHILFSGPFFLKHVYTVELFKMAVSSLKLNCQLVQGARWAMTIVMDNSRPLQLS